MGIHLNESHSEDGSQTALMPYLQAGNFTGVRCAKQTRGVWQLWTMSAICSGLYTGARLHELRPVGNGRGTDFQEYFLLRMRALVNSEGVRLLFLSRVMAGEVQTAVGNFHLDLSLKKSFSYDKLTTMVSSAR